MERGYGNERATLEDWTNHLTTIFTEVRLKKYIEVRTADSQPPALMLSLPALLKGVLYDDDCLDAAWDLGQALELRGTPRAQRSRRIRSGWRLAPAKSGSRNSRWSC